MAEATQGAGMCLLMTGRYEAARTELEASYEVARRRGFRELVAWHWWMVGLTVYPTDREAARALWERCLDQANDVSEGPATWSLGLLDIDAGIAAEALARLEACHARMVSAGVGVGLPLLACGIGAAQAALGRLEDARDTLSATAEENADADIAWYQAFIALDLAQVERLRDDIVAAQAIAEQALTVAQHLDHGLLLARSRVQLARIAAAPGAWAAADDLAHDALAIQVERGEDVDLPDALDALAEIAVGLESHEEAARLLGAADRARADLVRMRWSPEQEVAEALAGRLRDALGEEAFAAVRAEGEALPVDEAIAYVRRARGERKRPSGGWESLTPTELEVIRHVTA